MQKNCFFPDMPFMIRVYKYKWALVHSASSQQQKACLVPLNNCWSTADFVPPYVNMGFLLSVLTKKNPQLIFQPPKSQEEGSLRANRPVRVIVFLCFHASPPCSQHQPEPFVVFGFCIRHLHKQTGDVFRSQERRVFVVPRMNR